MKTIEILIAPDGQSTVETKGFSGSECLEASKFMEQVLGKQMNESLKPEFYQISITEQPSNQQL